MKKRVLVLTLIVSLCLISCAREKEKPRPQVKATLKISGSGTCKPLVEILTQEYVKEHPEVKIDFLPPTHSKGGVEGVAQGLLDIGLVSRELKPEEKALGVTYYPLSRDGLVLATHQSVKIKNLTNQQVKAIYAGQIKNWRELGGPDAPIIVLDRNEDESAKIILRQYVLGKKLAITPEATILYYESDMVEALLKTPNTIGYLSLGYALSKNLPLNIVSLNGVTPSVTTILNNRYPVVRPLGVVVKKPSPAAKQLIDFLLSSKAREIMINSGFAPYKEK